MKTQNFEIESAKSNIDWVGRKVTGAHNGSIAIKAGALTFNNDELTGGHFVIDTRSIKILDVTDPDTNAQFASHLASADFFNSDQYPEATFEITQAEPRGNGSYHVNGLLTIKDITRSISFDVQIKKNNDRITASGSITIDRTRFDMKFRSGNFFKDLGDTLIYNHFDLNVNITAAAVAQTAVA